MKTKTLLTILLCAALVTAMPDTASARRGGGSRTGAAIAGLAIGLGVGAILSAASQPEPTVVYTSTPVVAQPTVYTAAPVPVVPVQQTTVVYSTPTPAPVVVYSPSYRVSYRHSSPPRHHYRPSGHHRGQPRGHQSFPGTHRNQYRRR